MWHWWSQKSLKASICSHFSLLRPLWPGPLLYRGGREHPKAGCGMPAWSQCLLCATLQAQRDEGSVWKAPCSPLQEPQTSGGSTTSRSTGPLSQPEKGLADSHLIPRPRSIWRKYKPSCLVTHSKCGPSGSKLNGWDNRQNSQTSRAKRTHGRTRRIPVWHLAPGRHMHIRSLTKC